MKKKDYMKLSKERLAELLEEHDVRDYLTSIGQYNPPAIVPCFAEGGYCTNKFRDCINCPKDWGAGTTTTTTAGFKVNS